ELRLHVGVDGPLHRTIEIAVLRLHFGLAIGVDDGIDAAAYQSFREMGNKQLSAAIQLWRDRDKGGSDECYTHGSASGELPIIDAISILRSCIPAWRVRWFAQTLKPSANSSCPYVLQWKYASGPVPVNWFTGT